MNLTAGSYYRAIGFNIFLEFFMYSMKEACRMTNMSYENLKFYCNEGLVPNVKKGQKQLPGIQ